MVCSSGCIRYGPGDTTGFPKGNIGDSCSAMGRIAYFDARARKVTNDAASFETQLSRMQKDLLFYTWMHERYGCDGKMQVRARAKCSGTEICFCSARVLCRSMLGQLDVYGAVILAGQCFLFVQPPVMTA